MLGEEIVINIIRYVATPTLRNMHYKGIQKFKMERALLFYDQHFMKITKQYLIEI